MSDQERESKVPPVILTGTKLLSLYYRMKSTNLIIDSNSENPASEGSTSLNISYKSKRKNGFRLRIREEVTLKDAIFRATYEADFTAISPLPKEIYEDHLFQIRTINMVLPFSCELLASLTHQSYGIPIVTPSKVPERLATES